METIPSIFNTLRETLYVNLDNNISEDHRIVRIFEFRCTDENALDLLSGFKSKIEDYDLGSCVLSGETLRDIDFKDANIETIQDDLLTFVVNKNPSNDFYYFFTLQGFENALYQSEFYNKAVDVWIAESFTEFSSIKTNFSQWGRQRQLKSYDWKGLSNPRTIVRDLTVNSDYSVPHDIRPWLLRPNQDLANSSIIAVWKIAAAKNLLLALSSLHYS